jgi:tetratricopeptide (TPR) repeat protein
MVSTEAIACLKLAHSYLVEVDNAEQHIIGDAGGSTNLIRQIDLAMKQIEKAEQLDSGAVFEGLDIAYFKAWALGDKGFIENVGLGKRASAISNLKKAIELCNDLHYNHHALGIIYAQTGEKAKALEHLKRAIELAPDNMEYRKDLDRIDNISGAGMKAVAFRGSWKALLILIGLAVLCIIMIFSGTVGGGILGLVLFGGSAAIYWRIKTR